MGVGCSAVYPLAVSAAAQRTDRPPAVNVAALGQMTFVVFFLGPPLLGFVAQATDIRFSYIAVLPLVVAALLVIRALPARPMRGAVRAGAAIVPWLTCRTSFRSLRTQSSISGRSSICGSRRRRSGCSAG